MNLTFSNFTTDRVQCWRLIVEEYGPDIIYFPGTKNVVADFLSHQPFAKQSPNELNLLDKLFTANAPDDNAFPLTFDIISTHQQADAKLRCLSCTHLEYQTKIAGHSPIIYLHDWIIAPKSLQSKIISWHHSMLAHPGESHTTQTITQHFHWSSLAPNIKQHVQVCATCQHYKKQCKKYGHLPVKTHRDIDPWEEVHINLIGPWIVTQPPIKPSNTSPSPNSSNCKPITILALTMIDPMTNYMELLALPNKESRTIAHAFDRAWLCCYP